MVVCITQDFTNHFSYYEGSNISLFPRDGKWVNGGLVIVEGKDRSHLEIELQKGENVHVYLMNEQGQTIARACVYNEIQ